MITVSAIGRAKKADLASAAGAGVLGAGLGVVFAELAASLGPLLVVVGAVLHGWGMFEKRRIDAGAATPAWAAVLYWFCWIVLAAFVAWVAVR